MRITAATLSRVGRLAIDLLYPPVCALCGRGGSLLCAKCQASLPVADGQRCRTCWLPLSGGEPCRRCAAYPLVVTAVRSAFQYEGPARELVHRFKFGDLSALAPVMAAHMSAKVDWSVDLVAPVPLTKARERERGYNQSRLLARSIAAGLGAPLTEGLKRVRSAPPQALSASAETRRRNVRGAFEVRGPSTIAGRKVLLVDDVATTCATLDACAAALRRAGAAEVTAVTFARED